MKVFNLYYLIYIFIAFLHVYIVKGSLLVIFIVFIFELTRLIALLNRVKPVIWCLAVFSSIFIIMNYKTIFETSNTLSENKIQMINNINNYTGKYWLSADNLQKLINIQVTNLNSINSLPHWYVVAVFIMLIELSLAYMISQTKIQKIESEKITSKDSIKTKTLCNTTNLKIANSKYYKGEEEVSKSYYYKLKKLQQQQQGVE